MIDTRVQNIVGEMRSIGAVIAVTIILGCSADRSAQNEHALPSTEQRAVSSAITRGGFIMTTFRDETTPLSEQIYMVYSVDGKNWEPLNGGEPVLISTVGEKGVRDSYLLRSHDGNTFWLIATDLCVHWNRDWKRNMEAGSTSIVVWESHDLVQWSAPRLVRVAPDDAGCVWAPEAIFDEETGDYLVYWASTTGRDQFSKQRIWAAHTKDFQTFSAPFIMVDKPNHSIDIDIVKDGERYFRFLKDDKIRAVSMATSRTLAGPWEEMPQFTAGQEKEFEGPICYLLKPAENSAPPVWCLLMDNVGDRIGNGAFGYMPYLSSDMSTGKFTLATDFHFPYPLRHGSILPVSHTELERILSAFPVNRPVK